MKSSSAHKDGFTLIELIVVVVIMVVISGGALVSVIGFNQAQGTTDDAKTFITEMSRVYSKATGVFFPNGCVNLTGYTVSFIRDTDGITVTANCTTPVSEVRSRVLKASLFRSTQSFRFMVPNGALVPINPASYPVSVTIYNANSPSTTKTINLSSFGVFELL